MRATISLSPRQLLVAVLAVALGGGTGTIVRDLVLKLQPSTQPLTGWTGYAPLVNPSWTRAIPWVLLAINFIGVALATWILAHPLRHHDPNDPMRLLVITGFFGGFTSYSSLFVAFDVIWHRSPAGCVVVALGAVASGVLAAWIGLTLRWRS